MEEISIKIYDLKKNGIFISVHLKYLEATPSSNEHI